MNESVALIVLQTLAALLTGFLIGWRMQLKPLVNATAEIVMEMYVGDSKVEDHHAVAEISQRLGVPRWYASFLLVICTMNYPGVKHAIQRT